MLASHQTILRLVSLLCHKRSTPRDSGILITGWRIRLMYIVLVVLGGAIPEALVVGIVAQHETVAYAKPPVKMWLLHGCC